ncbi:unnamed protein product, partial [Timema podura]|nr:unnamed protein product [Timema podura]
GDSGGPVAYKGQIIGVMIGMYGLYKSITCQKLPRIAGGQNANIKDFPFMKIIIINNFLQSGASELQDNKENDGPEVSRQKSTKQTNIEIKCASERKRIEKNEGGRMI